MIPRDVEDAARRIRRRNTGEELYVGAPRFWMGAHVPLDLAHDWDGEKAGYWRQGVLAGLRAAQYLPPMEWYASAEMDQEQRRAWREGRR